MPRVQTEIKIRLSNETMLIMETVALVNFSTFVANLNLLMYQLALAAVTNMLEAGALSGA